MNNFKGLKNVLHFTYTQAVKRKGYRIVTALIAILIISVVMLVSVISAKPEEDKNDISKVFVLDDSGLIPADYSNATEHSIEFCSFESGTELSVLLETAAAMTDEKILVVHITSTNEKYLIEATIPDILPISSNDANEVLEAMKNVFETNKLMQVGMGAEDLRQAIAPIVTSYSQVGEDTSLAGYLIRVLAPMIFGLLLYFLLLAHGQTICQEVSSEKTSKLMESLLTYVHPYALISGKVIAITLIALLQFLIWLVALAGGFIGGNILAKVLYPEYSNSVIDMIKYMQANIGDSALTLPAFILAIVIFCIGLLFYNVLAGVAGSMVSRPEDTASAQGVFTLPMVFSFLLSYLAPITENKGLIMVARYLPFTSPFCVPVELMTGTMSLPEGIIAGALLLLFSLFFIVLSARIYKGLVLYNGAKLSLKTIKNVLKK